MSDNDDFEMEEVLEYITAADSLEEDSDQDTQDKAAQTSNSKIKWKNSSFMPVVHDFDDNNSGFYEECFFFSSNIFQM